MSNGQEPGASITGHFLIPAARWHYVVTSYASGEPDPEFFKLPAGYFLQKKEPTW